MQNLYKLIGIKSDASSTEIEAAINHAIIDAQNKQDKGDLDAPAILFNLREAKRILLNTTSRTQYNIKLQQQEKPANSNATLGKQITAHKQPTLKDLGITSTLADLTIIISLIATILFAISGKTFFAIFAGALCFVLSARKGKQIAWEKPEQ
jgi:hypothetical protein